jgi:microcystin degradation protein MlrC
VRVGLGGIWHETNTFFDRPTTLDDFRAFAYFEGGDLVEALTGTGTELGGALAAARDLGVEAVPLVFAGALPSGPVSAADFDLVLTELIGRLRSQLPVDGVVLALHGAMVVEGREDPEADIVAEVRRVVGDLPVAVTLDYHANVSGRLARLADVLCGYRTYPHVDLAERGYDALEAVVRAARRGRPPRSHLVKLPLLTIPVAQESSARPMRDVLALVEAACADADVWTACALPGFAYSDGPRLGFSVYVAADRDPAAVADEIAREVWARRGDFAMSLLEPTSAVRRAMSAPAPAVLVDVADNVGGGSPGDSTAILHALQREKARGAIVVLWDPAAAAELHSAGAPTVSVRVGGRSDPSMGPPALVSGAVRPHGQVRYRRTGSYMTGAEVDMGRVAVIESEVGAVVITENRIVPFDDDHLTVLGLAPRAARILVAKGAIAWKAAFGDYAASTVYVDGPGTCPVSLDALNFAARPRPLYPFEPLTEWSAVP